MQDWQEVAAGVFAGRCAELDLTVGLVLGRDRALVVDVGGDREQGAELARAIGAITAAPRDIVFTHGHFDHCFGAEAFRPAPVWAHEGCAAHLRDTAERQRASWIDHYRGQHRDEVAEALARTDVRAPDHLITDRVDLDLGGRRARLRHLGAGHTDHDLVVEVPDSSVVFAGDLVEHGAPPDFEDAVPDDWPSTVDALLGLDPAVVVPGHGDPVDPAFVRAQRDELAAVAEIRAALGRGRTGRGQTGRGEAGPGETGPEETDTRETGTRETGTRETGTRETGTRETGTRETGHSEISEAEALRRSPYPAETTLIALRR